MRHGHCYAHGDGLRDFVRQREEYRLGGACVILVWLCAEQAVRLSTIGELAPSASMMDRHRPKPIAVPLGLVV